MGNVRTIGEHQGCRCSRMGVGYGDFSSARSLPRLSSGWLSCCELSQGFVAFSGELQANSPVQVALTQQELSDPTWKAMPMA